ncbi:hypothetical protein [Actinomadura sp. SCN-SB]|uniref:hypothetical protein n=1 Tax=Actinomadura sp. SCN-SB TaxID=3373092 RepID=UPI0037524CBF
MIHRLLRTYHGGYHRLCVHRSHRLRLPCYRGLTYDGLCTKHNRTCFNICPREAR